METKTAIRRVIQKRRTSFTGRKKTEADNAIYTKLVSLPVFQTSSVIFTYVSQPCEVDTRILISNMADKKTLVVPKITNNNLSGYTIHSLSDLKKGSWGIQEPKDFCKAAMLSDIHLFIIPLVACDRYGNRVGSGYGYFDTFLADVRVPIIGLAYSFQVVNKIPIDPHDKKVDIIVTETDIYDLRNSSHAS